MIKKVDIKYFGTSLHTQIKVYEYHLFVFPFLFLNIFISSKGFFEMYCECIGISR